MAVNVSQCLCNPFFTGIVNSLTSQCIRCGLGELKLTASGSGFGDGQCKSTAAAVSAASAHVTAALDGLLGGTTTAANSSNASSTAALAQAEGAISNLASALGTDASEEAEEVRGQLVEMLLGSVKGADPIKMEPATVAASLNMISSITASTKQVSPEATDNALDFVDTLSQASMSNDDAATAANAISNLFTSTVAAAGNDVSSAVSSTDTKAPAAPNSAVAKAAKRRGNQMATVLQRVALALVRSTEGGNSSDPQVIVTDTFALAGHSLETSSSDEPAKIAAAGCSVSLPASAMSSGRRRLDTGSTISAAQTVRYSGAGPHFWAGDKLATRNAQMATDALTISFFSANGKAIKISNLKEPATLELPISVTGNMKNGSTVYCTHWSTVEDSWVVDGVGHIADGKIICETTHFTDFAAFAGPPERTASTSIGVLASEATAAETSDNELGISVMLLAAVGISVMLSAAVVGICVRLRIHKTKTRVVDMTQEKDKFIKSRADAHTIVTVVTQTGSALELGKENELALAEPPFTATTTPTSTPAAAVAEAAALADALRQEEEAEAARREAEREEARVQAEQEEAAEEAKTASERLLLTLRKNAARWGLPQALPLSGRHDDDDAPVICICPFLPPEEAAGERRRLASLFSHD